MRVFFTGALLLLFVMPGWADSAGDCQKHFPLGRLPGADQVMCYDGYAVGYSYDHKIPLWTSMTITSVSANGTNVERQDDFRVNREVPSQYRSRKSDYRGSGYDRGHMAESGSIDYSRQANSETFLLTNMVPQRPGFNRDGFGHAGIWGYLENQTRDWVNERGDLYVVSGTIASGATTIGSGVSVPEAFYKIFIDLETGETISFLMPHEDDLRSQTSEFLSSIDQIESASGLDFFSRIVDAQEDAFEAFRAKSMW